MRARRGYHEPPRPSLRLRLRRRDFLAGVALLGASPAPLGCRAARSGEGGAPLPMWGVQSGDVTTSSAVVWCRSNEPARLVVEWATSPSFGDARRVVGPVATPDTALAAKVQLEGLPADARIHYRARFESERASEWVPGSLVTAPDPRRDAREPRDVRFAWSGDTNGQGWGIDPSRGGMPIYATILAHAPELFVHCGDTIYADNPIPPAIALPDGTSWNNVVTDAKSRVAATLEDFRGAQLYPRHAAEVRALSAAAPTFAIWDDHEVMDDWFPGDVERHADALAPLARRAFYEHLPTLMIPATPMYRSVRWGSRLEIFFVDGRSYRSDNHPVTADDPRSYFGDAQIAWLADALARSTATWKVVAADQPLGLVLSERLPSGAIELDAFGNDDGPPKGREHELASLLATLRARGTKNVVFVTADVHYAAAHRYAPERAAWKDMDPFWEFVAGPLHADAFPRKPFDDTFGPELVYASADARRVGSPFTGDAFFGLVDVEGKSGRMTVRLIDVRGDTRHTTVLDPA